MNELQLHVSAVVGTLDERGHVPVSITQPAVEVLLAWDSDQQLLGCHGDRFHRPCCTPD